MSSITVYEKVLRGFERVPLAPGEKKTLHFTITPKDLSLLDANFQRVVEPGDFDIMIGASSTDIRLQKKLRVRGGDSGEAYPDDASAKKAYFPIALSTSEDVTIPLPEGKAIDNLTIAWGNGTDCSFEILWTKGGGQFLPIYKGEASAEGGTVTKTYRFEATEASEIRVGITRGKGIVCVMTFK